MTTNEKRAAIARVYSSESWQEKVAKMSDNQVIAIYRKFLADGKFDKEYPKYIDRIPKSAFKVSYLGKFAFKDEKEEPDMALAGNEGYKEDFEQLSMDGFKKTGRAGNSH